MLPLDMLRFDNLMSGYNPDDASGVTDDTPSLPVLPFGSGQAQKKKQIDFTPSTSAQDKLNQLMQSIPTYHQPGMLGRIVAGIIGAGYGPDEAMKFNLAGYNNDMNNWLNQVKVAQQSAQDENYTNNVNRQLAVAQNTSDQKDAALEAKIQHDQDVIDAQNKRAQLRSDTQKDIAQGKGVIKFDEAGQGWMVYPDGSQKQLDLTQFTPEELIKYRADQAIREAQGKPSTAKSGHWQLFQDKDGNMFRINQDDGEVQPVKGPSNLVKPSVAAKPNEPTTTTATTTTPGKVLGSTALGSLFGAKPEITKETTTVKSTGATTNYSAAIEQTIKDAMAANPKLYPTRDAVIAALKAKGVIK